jgi:hypothetical protein
VKSTCPQTLTPTESCHPSLLVCCLQCYHGMHGDLCCPCWGFSNGWRSQPQPDVSHYAGRGLFYRRLVGLVGFVTNFAPSYAPAAKPPDKGATATKPGQGYEGVVAQAVLGLVSSADNLVLLNQRLVTQGG